MAAISRVQGFMEFIVVMHRNCDCDEKSQDSEFQGGPLQAGRKPQKFLRYFIVKG